MYHALQREYERFSGYFVFNWTRVQWKRTLLSAVIDFLEARNLVAAVRRTFAFRTRDLDPPTFVSSSAGRSCRRVSRWKRTNKSGANWKKSTSPIEIDLIHAGTLSARSFSEENEKTPVENNSRIHHSGWDRFRLFFFTSAYRTDGPTNAETIWNNLSSIVAPSSTTARRVFYLFIKTMYFTCNA